MSVARLGFKSGDKLKDIENYLKHQRNLIDIQKEKENLMIKYNFKPESWPIVLGHARRFNFNSGDDLKDVNDYLNSKIWCPLHERYESIEVHNKERKNSNIFFKICNECGIETPHVTNNNGDIKCLACSGDYIWCEHCQKWETKKYNLKSNHWLFWKDETRIWMNKNTKKVNFLEKQIEGFDLLKNSGIISGIYGWFINDKSIYIGESTDILYRSYNHMMCIYECPEYWYDVIYHLDKNKIKIKVLKKIDISSYKNMNGRKLKEEIFKPLELYCIDHFKPDSQKCNGFTDHIKPINERKFKITI